MQNRFDHPLHSVSFAAMVLCEIRDNPLEGETAQSRLKQIGLMSVLYNMTMESKPLTIAGINDYIGLTRAGSEDTLDILVKRGLLTETVALNVIGRGRARLFSISDALLERLRHFERA